VFRLLYTSYYRAEVHYREFWCRFVSVTDSTPIDMQRDIAAWCIRLRIVRRDDGSTVTRRYGSDVDGDEMRRPMTSSTGCCGERLTTRRTSSLSRRPLPAWCDASRTARASIYNSLTKRRRWWRAGWSSMQSQHQQQQPSLRQAGIGLTRPLDNRVQTVVSSTLTVDKSATARS